MSRADAHPTSQQAWREIDRVDPPKRPAAERVGDFHEIYSLLDEATIREQASRCLQCPQPSCRDGCPLANRIPEWLALAAEGKFIEAAEISQATSNMPEICPRVCPQEKLCEGACILVGHAEPICIGAIEKFINEYASHCCEVPTVARQWIERGGGRLRTGRSGLCRRTGQAGLCRHDIRSADPTGRVVAERNSRVQAGEEHRGTAGEYFAPARSEI